VNYPIDRRAISPVANLATRHRVELVLFLAGLTLTFLLSALVVVGTRKAADTLRREIGVSIPSLPPLSPATVPGERASGRSATETRGVPAESSPAEAMEAAVGTVDLSARRLEVPVTGVAPHQLVPSFDEKRGDRRHEAIDILAPKGTPVRAVEDGVIARLFTSQAGGHTIYQFDPSGQYAYYYAHLDRYADGLAEGQSVTRGQVIGYVGSSGNATPSTPHLHFAIFKLGPEKRWWDGTPIDPYPILRPEAQTNP
jgi:peptidoglycan LD-endopeptidase LytH